MQKTCAECIIEMSLSLYKSLAQASQGFQFYESSLVSAEVDERGLEREKLVKPKMAKKHFLERIGTVLWLGFALDRGITHSAKWDCSCWQATAAEAWGCVRLR